MADSFLIIGGGGREHALYKAIMRSDRELTGWVYPGNIGIEKEGGKVVTGPKTWEELADWAKDNSIGLTVVGPELPLVEGVVDIFTQKGLVAFGPSKAAAELEGSKEFSKEIMKKYGIPTANWESFNDKPSAQKYLDKVGAPIVIKVSGLAGGKGALVCETMEEAQRALNDIYDDKSFGDAGNCVVIEEMMYGEEASIFVVTDGKGYKILPVSQDHKRIFDGDKGPNTGGMGAYAPAPVVDSAYLKNVEEVIIKPTLSAMESEGKLYRGLLYVGIMDTKDGPRVIEYNCRFGDPETEAVLPLVNVDWFELFSKSATGGVEEVNWEITEKFGATIILASKGYPATSQKDCVITGIDEAEKIDGVDVYHAGTALNSRGEVVTNGGRVLAITATDTTMDAAVENAYKAVSKISFSGMQYRTDIAQKGLKRVNK
jgi:phosphoribosylamine--glycine ligase